MEDSARQVIQLLFIAILNESKSIASKDECLHAWYLKVKPSLRASVPVIWIQMIFPPCFLDMHHLACWTCLVINYHPRPLIPCPMLTSALSYLMPLDLGYLRSQGGEQTMQTHTEPPIAPSAVRQHLHCTCKPEHNCLLWEFKSRLHFKNVNDLMEKRSVQ